MTWIVIWAALTAAAVVPTDVERGWYDLQRGSFDRATATATALLRADPDDLGAHRLYLQSRAKADEQGARELVLLYRAWQEAEPNRPAANWGLAGALIQKNGADACGEQHLLSTLPADAGNRYHALRIKAEWMAACGGDAQTVQRALGSLGDSDVPAVWSYGVYHQALQGDWAAPTAALDRVAEVHPARLAELAQLAWTQEGTGAARRELLAHAATLVASDDPVRVHIGANIFRTGRDGRYAAAAERVQALDPVAPHILYRPIIELESQMRAANRRSTDHAALAALDAMSGQIPPEGEVRLAWQRLRLERLRALGRGDEAFAALRDAARAAPDHAEIVHWWAAECAQRGVDLPEALAAMDQLLPTLDQQHYRGGSPYTQWAADQRETRGAWLDTRGWLLYQLGRYPEATAALQGATLLRRDGDSLARLALALSKTSNEDYFDLLIAAHTAPRAITDRSIEAETRAQLDVLWPTRGMWHPGGLDGWLDDRRTAERARAGTPPVAGPPHPMLGEDLPPWRDVRRVGGGEVDLSAERFLVVDLWATWCEACVARIGQLNGIATTYADRGVRVVGLSVDSTRGAPTRFFSGDALPAYDIGYLGPAAYADAQIESVPALFIVDAAGKIAYFQDAQGGPEDRRLEDALERLLH